MYVSLMINAMFLGHGFGIVAGEKRFNRYGDYILYVARRIYNRDDVYYGRGNNG